MIRYLLLVYILSKHRFEVPIGPLFREMVEIHLQLYYMAEIWEKVKELMIVSSPLVLPEMEPEKFLQLIDIVENLIMEQMTITTAKL